MELLPVSPFDLYLLFIILGLELVILHGARFARRTSSQMKELVPGFWCVCAKAFIILMEESLFMSNQTAASI